MKLLAMKLGYQYRLNDVKGTFNAESLTWHQTGLLLKY